ncbi:unnamed protein product [Caenorhabditis angaria]|uniref:Uncharacterized protein n=1 Tax=Caenorhabditis angaria TaxID=860376 RepID=A0A9P1N932_9PELO|nr:unnamed protein product [Caenorhabditis angaria]
MYNGDRYYSNDPRRGDPYSQRHQDPYSHHHHQQPQHHSQYSPQHQYHPQQYISHTNVNYGGPNQGDMDIAKTFDHEPFRHTDPKYKCLCNKMHVKQGCRFILAFLVGIVVLGILLLILNWNVGTWTTFILHAILLVGVIACAFALFVAMKSEKENLLLPVAGIAALGALISLIFFIFTLWSLIDPSGTTGQLVNNFVVNQNASQTEDFGLNENRDEIQTVSAVSMVLSLLGIAASIWVAFVVYKYFKYLKDMKFARNPKNQVHIEINDINKKGAKQ